MSKNFVFVTIDDLKKNAIQFKKGLPVSFVTVQVKIPVRHGHVSIEPCWAPEEHVVRKYNKTYRCIKNDPEQGMIAFIEGNSLYLIPDMAHSKELLLKNGFVEGDFCVPVKPETVFCNKVVELKWQKLWKLKKLLEELSLLAA